MTHYRSRKMCYMHFKRIITAVFLFIFFGVPLGHADMIERKYVDVILYPDFRDPGASLLWEDIKIPTRPGVRQRLLIAKGEKAGCLAVMLFIGGKTARITKRKGRRLRLNRNFLIRSAPLFARTGINTVLLDFPSDRKMLSDSYRTSKEHHKDIRAVVDFLTKEEKSCGVYLAGTSRGTLSVGYLATVMEHPNIKGYILTASKSEVVHDASRIKRPTLVVHHIDDGCRGTPYDAAQGIFYELPNNPRKHFVSVSGGHEPKSRPCQARSQHGFFGVERETVAAIVDWLKGKTPPKHVAPRN